MTPVLDVSQYFILVGYVIFTIGHGAQVLLQDDIIFYCYIIYEDE